jgi:ribose transport system permease protein
MNVLKRFLNMKESGIIIPTIVFIVVVQIVNPVFLSFDNIINILRTTGFTLITAVGMTFVLIAGGLDLSVGSVVAVGGVAASKAVVAGIPLPLCILIGVAAGLVLGIVNGLVIVKFKIPPLIMTLGMLYMARGLVYIVTKGVPVYPLPETFQKLEQSSLFGIPTIVIVSLLLALLAHFILVHTTFGRSTYAVGGNTEAAMMSGIRINSVSLAVYAMTGAMAALTGIFMASRLSSAQAGAGSGFELTVIAAVIIGGTSTFGGAGSMLGTIVGALFMNILSNSMTLMKISVYWQNLVIGAILVFAVIIDQENRKRQLQAR